MWLRADRQTGGKGRQGRLWLSPPGNLYVSTLVRIRLGEPPAPTLALVAAVALHEVLAPLTPGVRIKWPNDLVTCDGAKLAGILLERSGDCVVIGFGANLACRPDTLGRAAASVAMLAGGSPHAATLAADLAERFAARLAQWRETGLEPVRSAWLAAAHPEGTKLTTAQGEGTFAGLDESGALRLVLADGSVQLIHAGDVFLV